MVSRIRDALDRRLERPARKCTILLVALVAYLLIMPLLASSPSMRVTAGCLAIGTLVVGLFAVEESRRELQIGLALAVASILTVAFLATVGDVGRSPALPIVIGLFCCHITWCLLRFVLRPHVPAGARLAAALCAYLMIGFTWSMIYAVISALDSGAFAISEPLLEDGRPTMAVFNYYSYVTLTTLGYGDIQPISPAARAFSVIEAVTGVMYVAVMIASLVGRSVESHGKPEG